MLRRYSLTTAALVAFFFFAGCGGGGGNSPQDGSTGDSQPFTLGAHYYHWFPQNFKDGYLREKLSPPQEPLLGEYNSTDPRVAEQHIEWASSAGIDFFTLDWWPDRPAQNAAIDRGFLRARNLEKIRFCMFYETGDLGFSASVGGTVFGPDERRKFVSNMTELASRYFGHPQYLRIQGKPVVVLYITRTLTGEYKAALEEARAAVGEKGFELFLIGDEVFWSVVAGERSDVRITNEPQTSRISLFDGITAYNLYQGSFAQHEGYPATSAFFDDVHALYARYRDAAGGVPLFPSIIPGYNDRGVRPKVDHFPIPRQFRDGASSTSTLEEMYKRVLLPNLDPQVPIGFITSWNEWNEDTAIEPSEPAALSSRDSSSSGSFFTDGFGYEGVGTGYLTLLRRLQGQ